MKPLLLAVLLLVTSGAHAAEATSPPTVAAALAKAQREHRPVLVDFSAQWCYSCYFMASHVLNGPEWAALQQRVVVAEVDADSPDGAQWMDKLSVKALPAYVVLKPEGSELGRILAEQPRAKFYPLIDHILGGGDALDALKKAVGGGSVPAIAEVLAGYDARSQFEQGLNWYASLPTHRRAAAAANADVAMWRDRLRMEKTAKAKDNQACIAAGRKVLAANVGCDRYYVLESLLDCSEKLPADQRKSLLTVQRPALDELLSKQVFVDPPVCADKRTAVFVAADLDAAIGDMAGETAVLDHAIADARQHLGSDLAKDRNLADNLRVFLMRAKRTNELDALMPKLIAAYPDDYVYPYRYGRLLLEGGDAAKALPYLEQAADKAFGVNRLTVAGLRVKALLKLDRRADAQKIVADTLKANGPWFPEQAATLKGMLKS